MPGSVFDFRAIRARLEQLGQRATLFRPPGPARVLVVDDDLIVGEVAAAMLEHENYAVSWVADGHVALKAIEAEKPDLVLLDDIMPGLDGFEL